MTLRPENQKESKGRGGYRPNAGRKRGVPGKATKREVNDLAEAAKPFAGLALETLEEIARDGQSERARVAAASALLDRGFGKPRQALEHSGPEGMAIPITVTRTIVKP